MLILLVENDPDFRLSLEKILVDAGHKICWSATAMGALDLLRTEKIDLVLLDLELDGRLTGIDVARHVPRRIPVFILSGWTQEHIMREAASVRHPLAGVSLLLGKPLNVDELLRELRRVERISSDNITAVIDPRGAR